MSRNGPMGQPGARAPLRRNPAEHDPYAVPPTGQPAAHWPHQQPPQGYPEHVQQPGHAPQQHAQGYHFPQAPEPDPHFGYAPQQQASGGLPFDRYPAPPAQAPYAPQQAPAQQQWNNQHDTRGYDLGSYMPTGAQGYAQPESAHFQQPHDPQYAPQQHGYGENDAEYDEGLEEMDDEPRRGRRGLMIAAALVGAIGLGGGLAYTYKIFFASSSSRAPIVKAIDFPNKVKPVAPGGKEFAHTDKKLLERLGDEAAQPRAPTSATDAPDTNDEVGAPRRVRVIPITPNNQQGPGPTTTASVPPRPVGPAPMVAVPGLTVDMPGQGAPPPPAQRAQLPPQQQAQQPPPARVLQPPPARATVTASPPSQAVEPPKRTVVAAAPRNPVPKAKETSVAAAPTAVSGYVAVLSSQKSRMDALKAFADLQQKYGDVLASRTPDVQEANLGEKGIWYRAVVGPPGSRDAASGVCTQLKAAGYVGCWVTGY